MPRKNIYLDEETKQLLIQLAPHYGGNESLIIREAVKRLGASLQPGEPLEGLVLAHQPERTQVLETCGNCGEVIMVEGWREVLAGGRRGRFICLGCMQ